MGYLLYSLSFLVLVLCTVVYFTRSRWLPLLPIPSTAFSYQNLNVPTTFRGDAEAGLHSSDFDLAANITDENDGRSGLDARAKRDVLKIMRGRRVDFNEARRMYNEERFARNNIAPDGRPRDPKFVSFS